MTLAFNKRRCDLVGCDNATVGRARLCTACFVKLPEHVRLGISEAHHQRRWSDWGQLTREAADFLNLRPAARTALPAVTPQRAFELNARITGERIDL